jgi:hypothetical protein
VKIGSAFPSKYIKASDLQDQEVTVVIASCEIEEVGNAQKKEEKPVLYFKDKDKGFVLNKTNAKIIAKLYGDDTDDWIGKPITIYPTEVEFAGEMVESIRVRSKAPVPARKPAPAGKKVATPADGGDDNPPIPDDEVPF